MNPRLLPLAFFVAALVAYAAFHFLPWSIHGPTVGWQIWRMVLRLPRDWNDFSNLLPTFGFLSTGLLIVASPFLVPVFMASRLARILVRLVSLMAAVSLTGALLWHSGNFDKFRGRSGMICLIAAQLLHLAGTMLLRPADRSRPTRGCHLALPTERPAGALAHHARQTWHPDRSRAEFAAHRRIVS